MALKDKSTAQHVSNISSSWVYTHLWVASKLFFICIFIGLAFEYECFQTFAEVGRGLSGDCGSAVWLLSRKKKSQGALNVKKNANLCSKEKYLCVLLLISGVQPSRKMPSSLEINGFLKNKQGEKILFYALWLWVHWCAEKFCFQAFLCSCDSSNPISL